MGVPTGARLAMFVPPSIDFVSLVFALFKAAIVPVFIDPGMGGRAMLDCLDDVRPDGFIAVPLLHALRALPGGRFAGSGFNITVGRRWWWGGKTIADLRRLGAAPFEPICTAPEDPAAIIFTSGSTGPAKGVLYRHGNFDRQVTEIQTFYGIQPGEIDVPCFPLFALFNTAMGVTTVIPAMNFSRPARVNPKMLVEVIADWHATQSFGSPAVWNRVGRYCEDRKLRIPTLRRVLAAGAPVPTAVLRRMQACMHPAGEMHTPYGATEALPIASIGSAEVLAETSRRTDAGNGVCVGRRFPGIQWKIIEICDGPIPTLNDAVELTNDAIGELIVHGDVATDRYVTRTEANALAKIRDGDGFWHRMGDVGYLDAHDRFWFCGRMAQRVQTAAGPMFTIPCEAIFNRHPEVARSALVGIGDPWESASGDRRRARRAAVRPPPLGVPAGRRIAHASVDEPADRRHSPFPRATIAAGGRAA